MAMRLAARASSGLPACNSARASQLRSSRRGLGPPRGLGQHRDRLVHFLVLEGTLRHFEDQSLIGRVGQGGFIKLFDSQIVLIVPLVTDARGIMGQRLGFPSDTVCAELFGSSSTSKSSFVSPSFWRTAEAAWFADVGALEVAHPGKNKLPNPITRTRIG